MGYLPGKKYGGPVASLYNLTELLGNELDIYIICSNHDMNENTPYIGIKDDWNQVGKAKVKYMADSYFQIDAFEKLIKDIYPQLICVSSIFSAVYTYPVLSLAKKYGIPLLLAPRGELLTPALQNKWIKKKIYLCCLKWSGVLRAVYYHATSEHEKRDICKHIGVDEERVFYLPNISGVSCKKVDFQKEKGTVKICFSGRIVKNKNLLIALQALMNAKSKIVLDIFGALEDRAYWERCNIVISKLPDNVKVNYLGNVSSFEMQKKYQEYQCLLSPTEFENYGHSIVEAMLHDVPVIVSKGRTPWDDLELEHVGFVVSLEKLDEFTKAVDEIGQMDIRMYAELIMRLRKYCEKKFDLDVLKKKYINAFSKIIQESEGGCRYAL